MRPEEQRLQAHRDDSCGDSRTLPCHQGITREAKRLEAIFRDFPRKGAKSRGMDLKQSPALSERQECECGDDIKRQNRRYQVVITLWGC